MSLDFDIQILLAQAKDDPRLKAASNSLRRGIVQQINEPLLANFDGGASPLLFSATTETPNIFDVKLELFVLLKLDITNDKVFISDLLANLELTKKFKNTVEVQDFINKIELRLNSHTDIASIVDKIEFLQKSGFFNKLFTKDLVHSVQLEDKFLQNKISTSNPIAKFIKEEFHNRKKIHDYPNYELANRLSKEYNVLGGFGRDFGITGEGEDSYYWVNPFSGFTIVNNRPIWGLNEQNRHPKYGTINPNSNGSSEIPPLEPYFLAGSNPPFWQHNNGGWVYWWMPGYRHHNGLSVFEDLAYTGVPLSNNLLVRNGNIYIWNLTSSNPYIPNYFASSSSPNYWKKNPEEVIDARTLPSNEAFIHEPGTIAAIVNEIVRIRKDLFQRPEQILASINLLNPKSKIEIDNLKTKDIISRFIKKDAFNNLINTQIELHPFKYGKGLKDIVKLRLKVLRPKANISTEKILAKERKELDVTKQLKASLAEFSASDKRKKVTKKVEEDLILDQLFLNPKARVAISQAQFKDFKEKDVTHLERSKLKLISHEARKKVVTKDEERAEIRENILNRSNAKIPEDLLQQVDQVIKKASFSEKELADLISFTSRSTEKPRTELVELLKDVSVVRPITGAISKVSLEDTIRFFPVAYSLASKLKEGKEVLERDVSKVLKGATRGSLTISFLNSRGKIVSDSISTEEGAFDFRRTVGKNLLTKNIDLVVTKSKVVTKPFTEIKTSITDSPIEAKSEIITDSYQVDEDKDAFLIGKFFTELKFHFSDEDETFLKIISKPIAEINAFLKDSLLYPPAKVKGPTETCIVFNQFHPWIFSKTIVDEKNLFTNDTVAKSSNKSGITNTLSSSEKGFAFVRDEEYVKGAYFLQPYVATIPPGRSRQF